MFKIVGVGGCGVNAVNYMFRKKIGNASFVVCDTDRQSLENSAVPQKLLLGSDGLGTGGDVEKGYPVCIQSWDEVKEILSDDSKVIIVIAGMGGGTGTIAAPFVGATAMFSMEPLLTSKFRVGIITLPFKFEGKDRMDIALFGANLMKSYNTFKELYAIDNDSLAKNYSELTITDAFKAIDETLCEVVEKVMEAITANGISDVTFQNVRKSLLDNGTIVDSHKLMKEISRSRFCQNDYSDDVR